MKYIFKYLIFALLMLSTLSVAAQNSKEERAERKKARTELRETLRANKNAQQKRGPVEMFENPDGTLAVVLLNRTDKEIPVIFRMNGQTAGIQVRAQAIETVVMK